MEQTTEAPEPSAPATRAEVNREIGSIAQAAGLGHAWADRHIDAEAPIEDVRCEALAELAKRSAAADGARPTIAAPTRCSTVRRWWTACALAC
jgi:hypothetical protein